MTQQGHNGPITAHVRANGEPTAGPALELLSRPIRGAVVAPNRHQRRAAARSQRAQEAAGRRKARALLAELERARGGRA